MWLRDQIPLGLIVNPTNREFIWIWLRCKYWVGQEVRLGFSIRYYGKWTFWPTQSQYISKNHDRSSGRGLWSTDNVTVDIPVVPTHLSHRIGDVPALAPKLASSLPGVLWGVAFTPHYSTEPCLGDSLLPPGSQHFPPTPVWRWREFCTVSCLGLRKENRQNFSYHHFLEETALQALEQRVCRMCFVAEKRFRLVASVCRSRQNINRE